MRSTGSPLRHGLTLTEVLIVIALLAVLAGMVLPVIGMRRETTGHPRCAKNLSQIMGACVAYSTTEEVPWPSPWPAGEYLSTIHIADAHQARLITVQVFAILAKVQSLPNSVFACDATSRPGPALTAAGDRAGAIAWGAGPDHAVSYAWDWACPTEPGAARVIGADRSPANHKGRAMAVFGDSHVKALKGLPGIATGLLTEDNDGMPVTSIVSNPDAAAADGAVDDIYSPAGDGGDPLCPGKGGALGTWVK